MFRIPMVTGLFSINMAQYLVESRFAPQNLREIGKQQQLYHERCMGISAAPGQDSK